MKRKIGQYEIGELLGEGGIGQVHAAFDTVLQRNVAMKSLRPELLSDANFVERFRAEATSLARLNHPNITTIYSLIPEGKNLYMVMELVRGHTLDEILTERKGPLDVPESLAIVAQAADGLNYAHSMGVIHRDIKPSNLMVADNGVLKIMDFGIARVRGTQRLTRSGSIVGTLAYMAPEQLRGEEGDESCDLYSLAIVLYELLSGAPPFNAPSEYDLMQAQINQKPDRLIPRVSNLEPAVETALLRALSKKPDQRFASTRAFSDALGATALRVDAPKILHNDTRLIEAAPIVVRAVSDNPVIAALPQAIRSFTLPPALAKMSSDMRAAVYGGGAALVAAIGLIGFMLFHSAGPGPKPASAAKPAPTVVATAPAKPPPATVPPSTGTPAAGAPPNNPMVTTSLTTPTAPLPPAASPGTPPVVGGTGVDVPGIPAALAELVAAADRGDPAAQNTLGVKYADGEDGLPRDDVKAVEWYRKAALAGYAKAQTNLGDMYFYGRGGLDKSFQEAFSWYLKAANQDFADAQYRLAVMYERGIGTAKDIQSAVKLYRSAAEHGSAEAQNVLGTLYAIGDDGLPQDNKAALEWYQKAAAQGLAKAEKNLGEMYFFGRGTDRDYAQALVWYQKAADQNSDDARYRLGFMYEKGLGTPPNIQKAIEFYQTAARGGNVDAQHALDRLHVANQ